MFSKQQVLGSTKLALCVCVETLGRMKVLKGFKEKKSFKAKFLQAMFAWLRL